MVRPIPHPSPRAGSSFECIAVRLLMRDGRPVPRGGKFYADAQEVRALMAAGDALLVDDDDLFRLMRALQAASDKPPLTLR